MVVGILSRAVLTSASGSSDGTLSVTRGILRGRLVVAWGGLILAPLPVACPDGDLKPRSAAPKALVPVCTVRNIHT